MHEEHNLAGVLPGQPLHGEPVAVRRGHGVLLERVARVADDGRRGGLGPLIVRDAVEVEGGGRAEQVPRDVEGDVDRQPEPHLDRLGEGHAGRDDQGRRRVGMAGRGGGVGGLWGEGGSRRRRRGGVEVVQGGGVVVGESQRGWGRRRGARVGGMEEARGGGVDEPREEVERGEEEGRGEGF